MAVPQKAANMMTTEGVSLFFREVKNEMKKVAWPSKQELIVNTIVVIVAVFFVAGLIWLIDMFFGRILRLLLGV